MLKPLAHAFAATFRQLHPSKTLQTAIQQKAIYSDDQHQFQLADKQFRPKTIQTKGLHRFSEIKPLKPEVEMLAATPEGQSTSHHRTNKTDNDSQQRCHTESTTSPARSEH